MGRWTSDCSPQTQRTVLLLLHSLFTLIEMFSFLSNFTLKQVETREGWCLKWKRKHGKASNNNLPRMLYPPASLRCTARSHCKDSALDFCSFFQVCTPLSDRQYTQVYKAHSDKIPARGEDQTWASACKLWAKLLWMCLLLHVLSDARSKEDTCLPLCLGAWLLRSCEYWEDTTRLEAVTGHVGMKE